MNNKKHIAKIINEWDPIELFPYSPIDEYEIEIEMISKMLSTKMSDSDLAKAMKEIFCQRFGDDVFTKTEIECIDIARKILKDNTLLI